MPAGYLVLALEAGSTFSTKITVTNTDGSLLDLTGATGFCKMRKSYYSTSDVYDFVVSFDSDMADGVLYISMDAATSETIDPGRYVFDVCLVFSTKTTRVLEGIIEVRPCASLNLIDTLGATGI